MDAFLEYISLEADENFNSLELPRYSVEELKEMQHSDIVIRKFAELKSLYTSKPTPRQLDSFGVE